MRDAEKTVDRLLAGLRSAQPSARLEERVLARMENAMEAGHAAASDSAWRRLLLLWRLHPATAPVCIALAAILVACLFVATSMQRHRRPPAELRSHSIDVPTQRATIPTETAQEAPIAPRHTASRVALRRLRGSDRDETEAESLPAPPVPLTEQEKLLLRLAHRRDPQNMAILNRDEQATQSAKDTEQFQQFFGIKPEEMRIEIE
jgi:hypothetical protein